MKQKAFDQAMIWLWLPPKVIWRETLNCVQAKSHQTKKKILLVMKLVLLMMTTCLLQVNANGFAQQLTYSKKGTNLAEVFNEIRKQTGYYVFYSTKKINTKKPLDVNFKNTGLKDVLKICLEPQNLDYTIENKNILITKNKLTILQKVVDVFTTIVVQGKVVDEKGLPLPNAIIQVKGKTLVYTSDEQGTFSIPGVAEGAVLIIRFVGRQTREVEASANLGNVVLIPEDSKLDEIQIIGYGQTTKRLNTGSVSTITVKQIEQQPVTNILSSLSGRMPGVFVQTTNGLPGGNINIQIRGKGSISAGTAPLYIIDGVPFESILVAATANIAGAAITGATNPLNSINPSDIESINILKDADATAIYGSRGTNGVILISTKKGKRGATKANLNISQGYNKAASFPKLLNLEQYLMLRKEAFANDNLKPNTTNAPDLLTWDQSTATNWPEYLFGNTSQSTDLQAGLSGGAGLTTFNTAGSFHQENNVISSKARYIRGGLSLNLNHQSEDQKLEMQLTNNLVWDRNKSPNMSYSASGIMLPPNLPLFDDNGQHYWYASNPLAEMEATTNAQTSNIISNLNLSYALLKTLKLSVNAGYNTISISQTQLFPTRSLFPGSVNYAQYGQNDNSSFIVEPQLNFRRQFGKSNLTVLIGGTYQDRSSTIGLFKVSNFSNEELMENIASATTVDIRLKTNTAYKYLSGFSRLTYSYGDKYILNATVRRDGSSRFGNGNQFGNFGALGAAWLFSEEAWLKVNLPLLSFGKLRGSYGLTGNDQITDYQFLSTYNTSGKVYQGLTTLSPARIDNANFHWETTAKLELALELGLFKNKILFNLNYYQNRSIDQLVLYALPSITGFPNYQANLPAVVENKGWEFELNTLNFENNKLRWSTTFNISLPKNKLISFENFQNSSYKQTLQIGYDINKINGYQLLRVDQETGKAIYADQNGNPSTSPYSGYTIGKSTPDYYGGIGNVISYKGFSIDVFFQFAKQMAKGGIRNNPGVLLNNYAYMLKRWQQPGNISTVPKASTISDIYYTSSSANFFDASYIRFKNLSIGYVLPEKISKQIKAGQVNIYLRAQNLITFWHKENPFMDPESGGFFTGQTNVAPGKSFIAGINFTF
ncbi:SusC/RagA family TonB-linked outer membrane protein [Pedobacter heparinus]|uniref:SusC/RagA family TonB-linked outer membrane protein n=1 Tax=Pedobacter heparinus TaxID=984 RepID=UPI00292EDA8C|nr:SusC/RagA family TonB-linked outer membrane protein [Pedobacter heparinus]